MGRSAGKKSRASKSKVIERQIKATPSLVKGGAVVEGFTLIDETKAPKDVGSESHRRRLEAYLRSRVKGATLTFEGACGNCSLPLEEYVRPGEDFCQCEEYIPTGQSRTDLKGGIVVQTDAPPEGTIEEKEVCMRGFLDHEICHEVWTSTPASLAFFRDLKKMSQNYEERKASQLKWISNVLEDGMIEEREREFNPDNFKFISACNYLWPRTGKETWETKEDQFAPLPDGYIPEDADGNPLEVRDGKVFIPAGTRLSVWGEKPLDPATQARVALMTMCFPEHEHGVLNPEVARVMKECEPHIEAAVSGNTSDCIARTYEIQKILRDNKLLQDEMTPEEREQIKKAFKDGKIQISIGSGPGGGGGGGTFEQDLENGGGKSFSQLDDDIENEDGEIPKPANGTPGGSSMSDELKEALESGKTPSGGKPGEKKEKGDGGSSGQNSGESGDSGKPGQGGGDGWEDPNTKEAKGSTDPSRGMKDKPLSKETREKNEKDGKGKASKEDVDKMKEEAAKNLAGDKASEQKSAASKKRNNNYSGEDWKLPDRNKVRTQRDLKQYKDSSKGNISSEDEREVASHGRRLGRKLKRMVTKASREKRHQPRGKLDSTKLAASQAGNWNVMKKSGTDLNLDMEIDTSIDLSGSTSYERPNIFKMAKMIAVAGKEAGIPTTIYGWQGSKGSGVYHYALKEKGSDDTSSLPAIFSADGGQTPTSEGIAFARARLSKSKAAFKLLPVITDGIANAGSNPADQIAKARKEGITVLGFGFGDGCDPDRMDEYFGKGNWVPIKDYGEASRVIANLIERQAKRVLG